MLGGTLVAHNAFEYDYPLAQALESLVLLCDEVVVVDAGSTDQTSHFLDFLYHAEIEKVRILKAEWNPVPHQGGKWLSDLGNMARLALKSPYHFHLQADEILDPADFDVIRRFAKQAVPIQVKRLNFWKDARHLAPVDRLCGAEVIRGGPTTIPLVGDSENLSPDCHPERCDVRIFHVGFLRKTEAMIAKGISMEESVWATHNPVYDKMKTEGRKPFTDCIADKDLIPYPNGHPKSIVPWLKERGAL